VGAIVDTLRQEQKKSVKASISLDHRESL
jgi:hypothetical protein